MNWNDMFMGVAGGVLLGTASALLMLVVGRIAGISGIVAGLLSGGDRTWRALFTAGLIFGGGLWFLLDPAAFANTTSVSLPLMASAGLLVGFGTGMGSGCTSGHGVCGIARLSTRSVLATVTFMASGVVTVAAVRLIGG